MTDEHQHRFWTAAHELPACSCGKTLLDAYNEAEENREMWLTSFLAVCKERDTLKEENQRLRGLLVAMTPQAIIFDDEGARCTACGASAPIANENSADSFEDAVEAIVHKPDCAVLSARAWIRKQRGEGNERRD